MKILRSREDFYWYKQGINVTGKREYKHIGEPERYPCMVHSAYSDNPYGSEEFEHKFFYQQEVTCDECGHITLVWPEEGYR